jgi:hypothetical protein
MKINRVEGQSQRRGSAAALLLGLRVRIRRGRGCLSLVSVLCSQIDVSASG